MPMPRVAAVHRFRLCAVVTVALACLAPVCRVLATELNLYVQPIESVAQTERAFKPLADYLSKKIGYTLQVRTESNFLTYWERMRRGKDFDLVLDAAHFYRLPGSAAGIRGVGKSARHRQFQSGD